MFALATLLVLVLLVACYLRTVPATQESAELRDYLINENPTSFPIFNIDLDEFAFNQLEMGAYCARWNLETGHNHRILITGGDLGRILVLDKSCFLNHSCFNYVYDILKASVADGGTLQISGASTKEEDFEAEGFEIFSF